mmetsp:Transcript_55183/g.101004  ORF Transcript_55183/g.101004 Transcript_55183/m.101004 type:complete len:84 (+) Transcript_55183:999-1250(+)
MLTRGDVGIMARSSSKRLGQLMPGRRESDALHSSSSCHDHKPKPLMKTQTTGLPPERTLARSGHGKAEPHGLCPKSLEILKMS